MASIDKIVSQVYKMFPAKAWNYKVNIYGGGIVADSDPDIMLQCSGINVPGLNIGFTQEKRFGIGHYKQMPTGKSFTEVNMTFYESESELEREYFVHWINNIYNDKTRRFSFYNDIVKTIQIIQYDRQGNKTYECKLTGAFPSNISPLDKSYASSDSVPQFVVNLQFTDMEETFYGSKIDTTVTNPLSRILSLF